MRHRCSSSLPPAPTKRLKSARFRSFLTAHGSHCSQIRGCQKNLPQYDHTCRRDCHRKQIHTFKVPLHCPGKNCSIVTFRCFFFFSAKIKTCCNSIARISDNSNRHGIQVTTKRSVFFAARLNASFFITCT